MPTARCCARESAQAGHQRESLLDRGGSGRALPGRHHGVGAGVAAGGRVFVLILVLSLGRRAKTVWWSLVPPLALALPMGIAALNEPRALLSDPGLPLGL